jgi:glutamyl/glutaminyl-tRNA synthetase
MEITHVIRGDDHISNTPRQILLYRAFGWETPAFAHVPMILGEDGTRLSKRHGATSVAAYRDLGYIPEALVNFLALLGWSYDGKQELFDLSDLTEKFRLERVGSNPAVFNVEKLDWMNGQHLKLLSDDERARRASEFLASRGHDLSTRGPDFVPTLVRAIGDRLKTLADAESYGAFVLNAELEMDETAWDTLREKANVGMLLDKLAATLETADFSLESLEKETRALAAESGVKAGDLIGSCRVALTGRKVSPGIFEVMALLGRAKTVARLKDAASRWRAESPLAKT